MFLILWIRFYSEATDEYINIGTAVNLLEKYSKTLELQT